ncbi:asparagine synthase (glutamine-hydrolyzing) [Magnetospirillum sp. ME-1]|uniref:asparagine synthase (glutamine-hydrolyzing) n=1 Tax=Magnetospirillum sp. ME-1 TaxID=1639348 RepID=UPI000A17BBFE|nr:asparagine synthase (glutamine-hydrolyzing) [Magnetospirillum sp. ME-1]ARJ66566.1 asparagine synthase (glutamine-hydrolyzing) [Magnetospirillum sp. ME-1]
MCGIAGLIGDASPGAAQRLDSMVAALVHRGPDGGGCWNDGDVHLGHRRLAVIDLAAAAAQPMVGPRGLVIVFNGEIYNHHDLRRELEGRGRTFRTQSDTEVLLAAWEAWGEDCLGRLVGMFAFALWDPTARRLFMVRDRLGKKPLYFTRQGDMLAFASEPKALLAVESVRAAATLDLQALSDFLSLGYVLSPKSIHANIRQLPPAHAARFDPSTGRLETWEYWRLADHVQDGRIPYDAKARERFSELLAQAVQDRLQADVPLGVFLSGGLDSAAVAAMAATSGARIRAFTVGFDAQSFDERPFARQTASHLGLDLEELPVDPGADVDLARLVAQCDDPFSDTSALACWHLNRAARGRVTVALSGDGADEILAGYPTYRADRVARLWNRVPAPVNRALLALVRRGLRPSYRKVSFDYKARQFLGGHGLDAARAHYWWRVVFSDEEKRRLLSPEILDALGDYDPFETFAGHFRAVPQASFLDRSLYVDIKTWLADDILVKADRTSMAFGLEVRSPFLDHRLVEFAARLDEAAKMNFRRQKVILRDAMAKILPSATLKRRKQGFNSPTSQFSALHPPRLGANSLFRDDFRLDPAVEDVTFKAFSLRVLGQWFENHPPIPWKGCQ